MDVDYSYVGAPTTQEAMETEGRDHPTESSETHTFAGPEASEALKLSALTWVSPFLLLITRNLTSWL